MSSPGILAWALEGLDRLLRNGRFTVPRSSEDAANLMMDLASPVSAFVRERCVRKPGESVVRDTLYSAWKTWAEDNGHEAGAKSTFGRNLRAVVPELRDTQPLVNGVKVRCYTRIGLQDSTLNAPNPVPPVPHIAHSDDGTGQPVPSGATKPQVNTNGTGGTGETLFKAQQPAKPADGTGSAAYREPLIAIADVAGGHWPKTVTDGLTGSGAPPAQDGAAPPHPAPRPSKPRG